MCGALATSDSSSTSTTSGLAMPKAQFNKYTGRPFSTKFWHKRKHLPVWKFYNSFMKMVKKNKVVILVGDTGTGKTTQVRHVLVHCMHSVFWIYQKRKAYIP